MGGITSEYPGSGEPEVFAVGEALGYPPERVVRFSYSGKETYRRQDTFVDLRLSAGRLAALVRRVGQTWPGHDVDLIAHSQGGLVAREYLKGYASSWDPHAPRVDHLVTFASPHQGAPLVGEIDEVEARTITGDHAMDVLSRFARSNGYVPDPHGASTQQMEPGSEFLTNLAEEDVLYGTRVLTLAMPYDFIVPANHARYPGQLNRVVPGPLGFHHRMVVESPVARGLARSFLRDAAEPCRSRYDATGPAAGRAISDASRTLDSLYWALDGSAVVSAGRAISRLLPLSAASGAVKVLSDNPAVRLSRGLAELSGRMGAPVRLFPTGPDP